MYSIFSIAYYVRGFAYVWYDAMNNADIKEINMKIDVAMKIGQSIILKGLTPG